VSIPRVAVLTRGCLLALAAAVIVVGYLVKDSSDSSSSRIDLSHRNVRPLALRFHARGRLFAVTETGDRIRPWKIEPETERAAPCGPDFTGYSAAIAPDGNIMAIGGADAVLLWDPVAGRTRHKLTTGAVRYGCLAFSYDGTTLAVPGDASVTLWDVATGARRPVALSLPDKVSGLAFTPDGRWIPDKVRGLAFAPDGRSLATGHVSGRVRLWVLDTGRERWRTKGHDYQVTSLAFSDDGQVLVSASDHDRVVRVWDPGTGRLMTELSGHATSVRSVAFAPGGAVVAAAASDGTVRRWDVRSGQALGVLEGDGLGTWLLAFSPDGRVLAAASSESSVVCWDLAAPPHPPAWSKAIAR
jgi:WD40 repeat protein